MGIFNTVQGRKPKKNKFDLSHEKKLSIKMGNLYPIMLQEVVPGDSFKARSEILLRLAPLVSPVMHRINVYTHYFFVPNRLVWNEWEDFITGGEDGDAEPVFPKVAVVDSREQSFRKGTLSDYFGIPISENNPTDLTHLSALPFRAYQLIYNEYFRDQNLEEKIEIVKTSGTESIAEQVITTTLRTRAWEKDYFTSALPWAQRGGEATIPLGEPNYRATSEIKLAQTGLSVEATDLLSDDEGNLHGTVGIENPPLRIENIDSIGATTINDLRKATRLQSWLEKSARGGSRYIEQILSHFGVISKDSRLARPEYLGGGRQPVAISETLSTVGNETEPQGNMAGHGISVGSNNSFTRSFTEHGYIIGLMSVLPKTAYQQGIERTWQKFDKFDHYWPDFAHLGEQEILNKEIFTDYSNAEQNEETFGYQQRYAEYKYQQSSVHGDFRDNLDFWHMGRIFDELPPLNEGFIHSDPTDRIFAVTDPDVDTMYVQIYNQISALRPMPYHSIPSL